MTRKQNSAKQVDWKAMIADQQDFLRPLIREILLRVMEVENGGGAWLEKGERASNRIGYWSAITHGRWSRPVGKLEVRVPQDRQWRFRQRTSTGINAAKRSRSVD